MGFADIVILVLIGIHLVITYGFFIADFLDERQKAKELEKKEKEQRLRDFSIGINDNFRSIMKLEKEIMIIDCRVRSLESKTKKGKSKK